RGGATGERRGRGGSPGSEGREPHAREDRAEEADGGGDPGGEAGAGPGDALGPSDLTRADIRPDHGDQRRADAEDQRNLQVLEPGAHAVAGQGERAEWPHEAGHEDDGGVREPGVERAGRAPPEDLPEMRGADSQVPEREPDRAPRRDEVAREDEARESEAHQVGRRRARPPEPREGTPAE